MAAASTRSLWVLSFSGSGVVSPPTVIVAVVPIHTETVRPAASASRILRWTLRLVRGASVSTDPPGLRYPLNRLARLRASPM